MHRERDGGLRAKASSSSSSTRTIKSHTKATVHLLNTPKGAPSCEFNPTLAKSFGEIIVRPVGCCRVCPLIKTDLFTDICCVSNDRRHRRSGRALHHDGAAAFTEACAPLFACVFPMGQPPVATQVTHTLQNKLRVSYTLQAEPLGRDVVGEGILNVQSNSASDGFTRGARHPSRASTKPVSWPPPR